MATLIKTPRRPLVASVSTISTAAAANSISVANYAYFLTKLANLGHASLGKSKKKNMIIFAKSNFEKNSQSWQHCMKVSDESSPNQSLLLVWMNGKLLRMRMTQRPLLFKTAEQIAKRHIRSIKKWSSRLNRLTDDRSIDARSIHRLTSEIVTRPTMIVVVSVTNDAMTDKCKT